MGQYCITLHYREERGKVFTRCLSSLIFSEGVDQWKRRKRGRESSNTEKANTWSKFSKEWMMEFSLLYLGLPMSLECFPPPTQSSSALASHQSSSSRLFSEPAFYRFFLLQTPQLLTAFSLPFLKWGKQFNLLDKGNNFLQSFATQKRVNGPLSLCRQWEWKLRTKNCILFAYIHRVLYCHLVVKYANMMRYAQPCQGLLWVKRENADWDRGEVIKENAMLANK